MVGAFFFQSVIAIDYRFRKKGEKVWKIETKNLIYSNLVNFPLHCVAE